MNKVRLLNVARALRESEHPEKFTMRELVNMCGTPGCALGHYASRGDLQDVFLIDGYRMTTVGAGSIYDVTLAHFGEDELFGALGCGEAKTPVQAAEYIERFVATHIPAEVQS
jgi:hypothetical protein